MLYYDSKKRDIPGDYFPLPKSIFNLDLSTGEIAIYAFLMYCEDQRQCLCKICVTKSRRIYSEYSLQYCLCILESHRNNCMSYCTMKASHIEWLAFLKKLW